MSESDAKHRLIGARISTTIVFLVNGIGIGAWAACLPALRQSLSLTDSALSLCLLAFSGGGLVGMPVAAWLVSRLGSQYATILLGLIFPITMVLPGFAATLPVLIFTALIFGMGKGFLDVAMNTFAAALQTAWRSSIMSSFHAAFSVGGLVGSISIGLMFVNGLSVLTALALLAIFSVAAIGACITLGLKVTIEERRESDTRAFAIPSPALFGIGLLCFLGLLMEGGMADWSGVYMTTVVKVSTAQAAMGYAAFSLMMVAGRVLGDWFVGVFGERASLLMGAISAASGFAISLGSPTFELSVFGFALVGLGASNLVPLLFSAASRTVGLPPATAIAMTASIGYAGFLIGPPLIGFASDHIGLRLALVSLFLSAVLIGTFGPRLLAVQAAIKPFKLNA
ncbi:Fucose permease [Phyllobacterium sp. YR620]|uniref:MFS transporter n=1 Tax=Phyllobacterium sp. YR620 TaxID=1881066 RepID=UPI00088FCDE9|nr:MFS transporter [Phyllobacterium sp. YR620]SDP76967.1 Fucose permease [Phyllobacterium sp. YR620]